jgi:membrane protease YdiL (CAAX protease family)
MSDAAISAKRFPREVNPIERCLDIVIVFAVSAIAFFLENLAIAQGWIPFATEVRGAVSVLAGASAAVWVVLARGGTLADLGFRRPKRWAIVPLQVFLVLIAFIAMQILAPLLVSSVISLPEPDLSRYDSITGNLGGAVLMALVLPLTASIPEEIIYRGFLIGRLSDIFGWNFSGVLISVFTQAIIFGAIHFQWGIGGMIVTLMMGLVWGAAYLLCGRNLWVVILAHSTGHILFVLQLYLGNSIVV